MRRPAFIFFLLVFYILFQFIWWAFLLIELNQEVYTHKIENVSLKSLSPEEYAAEIGNAQIAKEAFGVKRLGICAGIAIIKPHYPFHQAYGLAENLLKSAKLVKSEIKHTFKDKDGNVHIIKVYDITDNDYVEGSDKDHFILYYNPRNPSENILLNYGSYMVILFLPFGLLCSYLGWPHKEGAD